MKIVILAAAMLVSSVSFASTPGSYGPGAYNKTSVVCYGDSSKGNQQCRTVTYKYFAPRNEVICRNLGKDESGAAKKCFVRKTTGNYTYSIKTREERRLEEKNDHSGQGSRGKNRK